MTNEEISLAFGKRSWVVHLCIAASFASFFCCWIIQAGFEWRILGVPEYGRRSAERPAPIVMKGSTFFVSDADKQTFEVSRQAIPFTFLPVAIAVTIGGRRLIARQKLRKN